MKRQDYGETMLNSTHWRSNRKPPMILLLALWTLTLD